MEKIASTLVTGYLFNVILVELFDVRNYSVLVATITVIVTFILCIEFDRKINIIEARIKEMDDGSTGIEPTTIYR